MTDHAAADLAAECNYLHERLFGGPAPPDVVERYVAANLRCFPTADAEAERRVRIVVERAIDPEAVELVLRKSRPLLSRKIQILFYLLEVRAQYYSYFVNPSDAFGKALVELTGSALRTGWLFVKGAWLARRHRLV